MAQPLSAAAAAGLAVESAAGAASEEESHEAGAGGERLPSRPAEGEEEDDEAEEAKPAPPIRSPGEPTRAEREAHRITHLPYRPWCRHCVGGRKDSPAHHRAQEEEDEHAVEEVHFDYGYIAREEEETTTTVLFAKHRRSKMPRMWRVPRKGDCTMVASALRLRPPARTARHPQVRQ